MKLILLLTFLKYSVGQHAFSSSFKCGECLNNGYKSCLASITDHPLIKAYPNTDKNYNRCCALDEECASTSSSWSCTQGYNNTLYAKYTCPYNTQACGNLDSYNMTKAGEQLMINFTLTRGEVCFYKVKNTCGRLQVNITQLDNSDSILAEYLEFEAGAIKLATSGEVMNARQGGAPGVGMPWRVEPFAYSDYDHRVYQGRMFYGQGVHYWGSVYQGELNNLTTGSQSCADRNTFLVFTSLTDVSSNGKVQLTVLTYEGSAHYFSSSIVLIIALYSLLI